jgi:N-acetyl sugar amidotransferase
MDTSDPLISFDVDGVCNHCHRYDNDITSKLHVSDVELKRAIDEVKSVGAGKPYDCVLGLSGGADSSYLAVLATQLGLRFHAVTIDNGYDTVVASKNVAAMRDGLKFSHEVIKLDTESFRDVQLAFLRAGVPDLEIPTDHAIIASLAHKARSLGVSTVLVGRNIRTESHGTAAWSNGHQDWLYIKNMQHRFGKIKNWSMPHYTLLDRLTWMKHMNWVALLNYVDYRRTDAVKKLEEYGWRSYGDKHQESIYTRFIQGYVLPRRFGIDKRRSHLSSLICSGELTRDEALQRLSEQPYPEPEMDEDKRLVLSKLGVSQEEFAEFMTQLLKSFTDYPSDQKRIKRLKNLVGSFEV